MGKIYEYLGISVDVIYHDLETTSRRNAYQADITYGTNTEFGFDYLRDNMAHSLEDQVQRKHYYAIVDEVDSILVDEARTPLIISGPVEHSSNRYAEMKPLVQRLVNAQTTLVNKLIKEAEDLLNEEKSMMRGLNSSRPSVVRPRINGFLKSLKRGNIRSWSKM